MSALIPNHRSPLGGADKEPNLSTVLSPACRQIWDNSLLGIMIMDKDGVVLHINRLLIRTDDLEDNDILGKKMVDFYPMEKDRHISIQTINSGKPIIKKTILFRYRRQHQGWGRRPPDYRLHDSRRSQ